MAIEVEPGIEEETDTKSKVEEECEDDCEKHRFIDGVEDVFQSITSNIELILGTILAIVLQSVSTILTAGATGKDLNFDIMLTVLEFVIGPFIMLIVFKIINEKIDDKMKKISKKYKECIESLSKANKKIQIQSFTHKIELEREKLKHELDIEKLKYTKDIEIAQLRTALEAKNTEVNIYKAENDKLKKELELRTSS